MPGWKFWLLVIPLCLFCVFWFFRVPILRGLGMRMVAEEPPLKADAIVVLAGDGLGYRITKGAELARLGYAPVVIVSNGGNAYGHRESELATDFAVQHGYSPDLFFSAKWKAYSTLDEGQRAIEELRRRGAHKVLIVTTVWHTARAGRIYRRLAPDMEFHLVGSFDPVWHDGYWWLGREGRKTFFLEATKTIADYLGI